MLNSQLLEVDGTKFKKKRIENLYRLPLNSVHIWMVERRREHEDDELLEDIIVSNFRTHN